MRPKPTVNNATVSMCQKCNGTGLYVMEIRNGIPWSATGTTCNPCHGRGWIIRRRRPVCPRCHNKMMFGEVSGEPHKNWDETAKKYIDCL